MFNWSDFTPDRNIAGTSYAFVFTRLAFPTTGSTDWDGLVDHILSRCTGGAGMLRPEATNTVLDGAGSTSRCASDSTTWTNARYRQCGREIKRAYDAAVAAYVPPVVVTYRRAWLYRVAVEEPARPTAATAGSWTEVAPAATTEGAVWRAERMQTLHNGAVHSVQYSTVSKYLDRLQPPEPEVPEPPLSEPEPASDTSTDDFDEDLAEPVRTENHMTCYGGTTATANTNVLADKPIRTLYEAARVQIFALNVAAIDAALSTVSFKSGDKDILDTVPVPQVATGGTFPVEPMKIFDGIVPAGTLVLTFSNAATNWNVCVG